MSNHNKLTLLERQTIHLQQRKGWKKKRIARLLKRSPKTIREELRRNKHHLPGLWRDYGPYERAKYAEDLAKKRKSLSRRGKKKILSDRKLQDYIICRLSFENYSPVEISEVIEEELPGYSVSFKTIYNFTKRDMPNLKVHLYHEGKAYRQRVCHRRGRLKEGAPAKTLITKRPKKANERKEYGHWEVDTVHSCKGGRKAILSLRERKSRQRVYFLLEDLTAKTVMSRLMPFFRGLPPHMRKSITADNGSEFCTKEMQKLNKLGLKVYYCHAYKSQEKGAVEQSNWQLRKYFPKGTDFGGVSIEEVKEAERKLNNRPMKVNGFRSSQSIFERALKYRRGK